MFAEVLDREPLETADHYPAVQAHVAALSDDELIQLERDIEGRRREDAAREAAVLAELDRRKTYRVDGHASMRGLLRSTLGWSDAECIQRTRLAHLCDEHSDAGDTLLHAEVSVANVTEVARAAANPRIGDRIGSVIGTFLRQAGRREHDELCLRVRTWEKREDAAHDADKAKSAHDKRSASWRLDPDAGTAQLHACLAGLDALEVIEILAMYEAAEWETDWAWVREHYGHDAKTALMPRTADQRRADALANAIRDGASRPPESKPPKPVVNIHVDWHTWQDLLIEAAILPERDVNPFDDPIPHVSGLFCHTTNGHPVDQHTVLQTLLEGHIRWVIRNDEGIPIHWGRSRRLFEGAARDAVRALSTRCTAPGCRVPTTRCEIDHLTEYGQGGRTDPDDGNPACKRHNLFRHNHRYTVMRDRLGEWHTYRPDGTEVQ